MIGFVGPRGGGSGSREHCLESSVPVFGGWSEPSDVWMDANHLLGRCVAGRVGVEAAADLVAAMDQDLEPARIGTCSGSRDADSARMQHAAADGIDGGFAENDLLGSFRTDPEVPGVFSRARCHASPHLRAGSTQFGTDRTVRLSRNHQKDGIGSVVRIQFARFHKWLEYRRGEFATAGKIVAHAREL